MPNVEHILLESDSRQVPEARDARKVHATVEFHSRLRRRMLQLQIIDYYYLCVRSQVRSVVAEYVLDLRFVDTPRRFRHISWRWIACSLASMVLASGIAWIIQASATPWRQNAWLPVCEIVVVMWASATLLGVYRTTETVCLFSIHGAAKLMECTGGLGTLRSLQHFMAKLAAHIRLASGARRYSKAEQLRDEMREHQRLKEIGVLSAGQYEAAKVRILDQHAPAKRPDRPVAVSGRVKACHPNATVSNS